MTTAKLLYYLNGLDMSLTQAVDRLMIVDEGIPAEAWADVRGVTTRAVEKNVKDTETMLPTTDDQQATIEGGSQ